MKGRRKRIVSLLLGLTMVASMAVPGSVWANTKNDDIVILYTNDVHTYIDKVLSYDVLAGMKDKLETEYNHVLLVDAGDHIQGTAYGSMDKGKSIIDMMNAADYDLATLGNHEFDYGMEGRINVTDQWAKFPYISCNFYEEDGGVPGKTVLDAAKTYEGLGKWDVKFVGITTPETFTKSTPAYFQDANGNYIYGIAGGNDGKALYDAVQTAIGTPDENDIVIGLGHLGDDSASKPWTSEETIANVSGLDAFIDGHSHSIVEGKVVKDKDNKDVVLTQTGEYFDNVGMMIIDDETGAVTTKLISAADAAAAYTADADVKAMKDKWMQDIDDQLGTVIGKAEVTFDNYDADGNRLVRKQGTNTGAFAADALYYLFDNMDMDVDVAIMNGGGVRNKAITGDLTYKTCKEIHTFGNVACLQTVTGQQILDALEWGAKGYPDEGGGFLHPSGLTYDIDISIPCTVQSDDKGVWTGGPTGEYRVKNVEVYNKETGEYEPLDLDAKYNLAGYNYTLRDLGDGFAMFDGAVNVLDYVMEDYLVLANYVKSFPNATITAENSSYGAVTDEERIDFICTHDYKDGVCSVCGEVEPAVPQEVIDVMDTYAALQEALTSGDLEKLQTSFDAYADAMNKVSEDDALSEEFSKYIASLGYDEEELAYEMMGIIFTAGIITDSLGELYYDFVDNPSEKTAKAFIEYYDELVEFGFTPSEFDVFFGEGAMEAAYTDAKAYLKADGGEGEKEAEPEQKDNGKTPETGDDTNMLLWLGLILVAGAGMTAMRINRKED